MKIAIILYLASFIQVSFGFYTRCTPSNPLVECSSSDADGNITSTLPTVIENCYFKNCPTLNIFSNTTLNNVVFDASRRSSSPLSKRGIAVTVVSGNVTMNNCTIKNAYSPITVGGGMFIAFGVEVTIRNSRFENNTALIGSGLASGGLVTLQNVDFYKNKQVPPYSYGGFDVVAVAGKLHWTNGTSIWDTSVNPMSTTGASVWIQNGTDTLLENIVIDGAVNGGIVSLGTVVVAKNVSVLNMISVNVGCFYAEYTGANLTCINCLCKNAYSYNMGGGATSDTYGLVYLVNSTIQDIYAPADAKGICASHTGTGTLIAHNSIFKNCRSTGGTALGAIYADSYMELNNVTVMDSYATMGGAVYVAQNDQPAIIKNSKFYRNTANDTGGGIYIYGKAILSNLEISQNTAGNIAGGIYITNHLEYQVQVDGPIRIENNVAGEGGGIYMDEMAVLALSTSELTIKGNTVSKKNGHGAAMFLNQQSTGGNVVYQPTTGVLGQAVIQGDVWVRDVIFAKQLKDSGVFNRLGNDFPVSSSVASVDFITAKNNLESTTLDLTGHIPDVELRCKDLFGNIVNTVDVYDPLIIAAKLVDSTDPNSYLSGETTKGMLNTTSKSVLFKGLAVSTQSPTIKIMFYPLSVLGKGLDFLQQNVTFNVSICSNNTYQRLVPTSPDLKGRMQYVCLPALKVNPSLRYALVAISAVFAVIAIGLGIYSYHKRHLTVYKSTSPFFTAIITVGCIAQLFSIIPQVTPNAAQCMLREWLEFLGFALSIGSIILKTDVIKTIFLDPSPNKRNLSNKAQLPRLVVILVLVLLFLILWQSLRPASVMEVHVNAPLGWIQTDACYHPEDPNYYFPLTSVLIHILLEIIAAYLAYNVKNTPSQFNESRTMGLITYNWVLFGGILYLLALFLPTPPDISFIFNVLRVVIPSFSTIMIMHGQKIWMIQQKKAESPQDSTTPSNPLQGSGVSQNKPTLESSSGLTAPQLT